MSNQKSAVGDTAVVLMQEVLKAEQLWEMYQRGVEEGACLVHLEEVMAAREQAQKRAESLVHMLKLRKGGWQVEAAWGNLKDEIGLLVRSVRAGLLILSSLEVQPEDLQPLIVDSKAALAQADALKETRAEVWARVEALQPVEQYAGELESIAEDMQNVLDELLEVNNRVHQATDWSRSVDTS